MTTSSGPARLQLLRDASAEETGRGVLNSVAVIAPDDGHRAHPATYRSRFGADAAPRNHRQAENEIVGFACDLLDAPDTAVGEVGGAALDAAVRVIRAARDARPGLRRPVVVLPSSAHPAYRVAALTLDVVPKVVPVDGDGRAPLGPTIAALHDDVVLLVLSAPSFAHGVVDPVAWLAAAASTRQVPVHVDAGNGGWHLAYARRAGRLDTPWGFDVPGVASITLDVGPDRGLPTDLTVTVRREAATGRAGGRLVALSAGASQSWSPEGGRLADAAETLREIGHGGCGDLAARALAATAQLRAGIEGLPGLDVVARPDGTTLTLRPDVAADCFTLADELLERGWASEPLLSQDGRPPMLRFQVTAAMLPLVQDCLDAFAEGLSAAQQRGPARLDPVLGTMLDTLRPDGDVHRLATSMLEAAAVLDAALPTTAGSLTANLLIDAADPWVRDALTRARRDLGARPQRPERPEPPARSIVDQLPARTPASAVTDSSE